MGGDGLGALRSVAGTADSSGARVGGEGEPISVEANSFLRALKCYNHKHII